MSVIKDTSPAVSAPLEAKLYRPRPAGEMVPRPRLRERLGDGLQRKLVLVSAPAGFGKTTLVSEWLESVSIPAAWFTVDEYDNDLISFSTYLVAAVESAYSGACDAAASVLGSPTPPPPEQLSEAIGGDIAALPGELVLVLDDYHTIRDESVHAVIARLVAHPPRNLHMVIATRSDPPLPLSRMLARREVLMIRGHELRFEAEEANAFLNDALGADLSDDAVTMLLEHTEGWVAGLRLAALSARDRADPEAYLREFSGSEVAVADYLVDEVLAQQSTDTERFLLSTSVLDAFCAELCDAVAGGEGVDSRAIIDQLGRDNSFLVSIDPARGWFRYHALFRDLLRHRLRLKRGVDFELDLHLRAGRWLVGNGHVKEALRHYVAAGENELAAELVEERWPELLRREEWRILDRWLDMLPSNLVWNRPGLLVARAWLFSYRWQLPQTTPILNRARELLDAQAPGDSANGRAVRGEIEALSSQMHLVLHGDVQGCLQSAESALVDLPPDRVNSRGLAFDYKCAAEQMLGGGARSAKKLLAAIHDPVTAGVSRPQAYIALCYIRLLSGDLAGLAATAREGLAYGSEHGQTTTIGWSRMFAGLMSYERNDIDSAKREFEAATELRFGLHAVTYHSSLVGLVLTYQAAGRLMESQAAIDTLIALALRVSSDQMLHEARAVQARQWLLVGDRSAAMQWARSLSLEMVFDPFTTVALQDLVRVQVLVADGSEASTSVAISVLEEWLEEAERVHDRRRTITVLAHQALALDRHGEHDRARTQLERALEQAQPDGHVRSFVDLGPGMASLLHETASDGVAAEHVGRLLASFPRAPAPSAALGVEDLAAREELIEVLTSRELEVLALLDARLSNKEIAEELTISPETVSKHAGNIYQKLGVGNRRQASARARALGLLPDD